VCFNRPLADHLAQVAPRESVVLTYHQLCDRILQSLGYKPDFTRAGVFQDLEERFARARPGDAWRFDELIVDEGQDFQPAWVPPLLALVPPHGRAWWLEDPMQNIYGRPRAPLPGWVTLHADTNYRSPRDILDTINGLVGLERPIRPGSPLSGSDCEIISYGSTASLIDETRRALNTCIRLGFKRSMIAVVTYRGREGSALTPFDELGNFRLRKFTGEYDLVGSPRYTDGDVLLETVFRFKGQSAPAVVFTEIDFETLDENAVRRIFVGATRATMKLFLILSERSAKALHDRIDAG
jgi:superfamily I DNA/RNA helicase